MLLWLMLLGIGVCVSAQTITGTVTSATDASTLPGVSVAEKGTTNGTTTDVDGNFSITIHSNRAVLVFTYIGFITQEVPVTGTSRAIQVAMSENAQQLNEVVVVGYGTMKRSDLSGASSSIGRDQIRGSVITNIDQALQGRVAGINSVMTSGAPGSSVSIRIRGQATINAGADPLYVVDGVIWQNGRTGSGELGLNLGNGSANAISPLSTLNPADILSMEILKDASATAIYGSQGANGVVLITTRRGQSGKAKITYNGQFGVQNQVQRLDMMNLRQYATYANAITATTAGVYSEQPDYSDPSLLGAGTNWQDAIFRTALMSSHNLAVEGGNENVNYFVSANYFDQDGTIIATNFKRMSFRTNLDAKLNKWVSLGMNAMYSSTDEHLNKAEGTEGVLTYSLQTPPDIPIYDVFGNYATTVREGYTRINPIAIANMDLNLLARQKLTGSFFMDIKPVKWLDLRSEFGYDVGNERSENWQPSYNFGPGIIRANASDSWRRTNTLYWSIKNYLTYTNTFGKHRLTAMLGQETWANSWEYQGISASGLPTNDIRNPYLGDPLTQAIANGAGDGSMVSIYTRETYNYDDRYLMTYTFRYDGSSNFGPNNRWAPFHSVAASWRFSNEAFLKNNTVLSNGKLRIGWGQTGNDKIGGGKWDATLATYPTGLGIGYKQGQIANPYVQWETQEQWNLGLDLGFFHDRLNLTIDAYDKTSNNLLMKLQLPSYFGSQGNGDSQLTAPTGNFGTIKNRGLEITIDTRNIDNPEFKWGTNFNISFNKNKLVALSGTDASAIEGLGQWGDVVALSQIGGPLYQFYGYEVEGVYQSREDIEKHLFGEIPAAGFNRYSTVFVGDIKYKDLNGDGKITPEGDRTLIGNPLPKFTYGMTNTFNYKNLDLSIFIQGTYGNKVFNALDQSLTGMGYWTNQLTKAMNFANLIPIDPNKQYPIASPDNSDLILGYWFEDIDNVKLSNPNTNMPRAGRSIPYNNQRISTRYIEDGSYLRVKNIVLGYNLPSKLLQKIQLSNLRVYANIQNLFTFTKYTGYDPEVGINPQDANGYTFGYDMGRYPLPRTISFGLDVSF